MKNMPLLAVLSIFLAAAAPARAGEALSQLDGISPAKFSDTTPAAPAATLVKGTLVILDTKTGRTHVVISAGGGFIYASSGQFVPAVYTGSGYILQSGQYMPVVSGQRAKNRADGMEETSGAPAKEMWMALDLAARIEQVDFHVIDGGTDSLLAESLSCAEDNYAACSMFVTVNGVRKLVVTLDAGGKLILALAANGFYQEEENWTVYVSSAECRKTGGEYSCSFKP